MRVHRNGSNCPKAGQRLVRPPITEGGSARSPFNLNDEDVADGAGINHLPGRRKRAVVANMEGRAKLDAGLLAGADHPLGIGDAEGKRFVAKNVLARFGGISLLGTAGSSLTELGRLYRRYLTR